MASTRGSTVSKPSDSTQATPNAGQGLRHLQLLPEYRSDANDVVREFYEPCLERCQLYRRAVSIFTSSGLAAAARGITHFISGSGTMQLVASPAIALDDQDAIKRGYEARKDAIAKSLLRELAKVKDAPTRDRLGYLAWLIAEERLEIQIALPVTPNGEFRDGIYHEKLGIFEDALNDRVAFSGSANETAGGLVDNFESIDVFWSWDDHHRRVARKLANFDRLWKNETNGVEIYEFPEAVKKQLLTLKPASRPGKPPPQPLPPATKKWRHQDEAVAAFLARERGVLEMATGTGKTRTALRIVKTLIERNQIDSVVIAVDGNDLLDQWYLQIAPLCALLSPPFAAVRNYGTHKERDQFVLDPKNMILLASRQSLRPALRVLTGGQGHRTLIIHDEVHGFGSPGNRTELAGLSDAIRFRLGLSATPEREYDQDGTSFIEQNVGPVIYQFDLRDAITGGILSPFDYHPIEWTPSAADRERIQQVYKRAAAREAAGNPMTQAELWIDISKVYKTSLVKIPLFEQFITANPELLRRCIIFVETHEYGRDVLQIVHRLRTDFHTYFAEDESETLRRFARGELECLIMCHRLSQGIDIRSLQSVFLLSSNRGRLETIQRMGRCLRVDPENPTKRSHVIDFVRVQGDEDDEAEPTPDEERRDWLRDLAQLRPETTSP